MFEIRLTNDPRAAARRAESVTASKALEAEDTASASRGVCGGTAPHAAEAEDHEIVRHDTRLRHGRHRSSASAMRSPTHCEPKIVR